MSFQGLIKNMGQQGTGDGGFMTSPLFKSGVKMAGTAIGNAVLPGIGGALGGAAAGAITGGGTGGGDTQGGGGVDGAGLASMGLGLAQKIGGAIKKNKAQGLFPDQEDPELRALATNFARRKRAFQTGTALNSQASNIQALNKQGINAAFNAGGGQSGINRIAQMTAQAMGGLQNQALQGEMAFGQQEAATINRLAQTRLEKSLLKYNQAQAEAAQQSTTGNRNFMAGLAKTVPLAIDPSLAVYGTDPNSPKLPS